MSEFITAVLELRSRFKSADHAGLGHLEESLKRPLNTFLAAALEKAAQEKADSLPPHCPHCRTKLTALRKVERKVQTAFGEIKLLRLTGHCRKCKKRVCPADEALGLEKGYSSAVQESAALLASKMPVGEAAAVLERLTGRQLSSATIHRIAQDAGKKAKKKRSSQDEQARQNIGLADVPAPNTLVIMLDAWNIRERDHWGKTEAMRRRGLEPERWHWVWTGTVFSLEARAEKEGRPVIIERGYVATREGAAAFSEQIHAESLRLGLGKARKVLVMGDGASWIWNIAADRFKEAAQRIDYFHVQDHLWQVARQLHGDTPATKGWMTRMSKHLQEGRASHVIAVIEKAAASCTPEQRPILARECNYFREHQHRMDYDIAQELGEPSGSGAIESTCRQYQCRFKRPGQFWSKEGDDALLCLDTFWRNARWRILFPHIDGLTPSRN